MKKRLSRVTIITIVMSIVAIAIVGGFYYFLLHDETEKNQTTKQNPPTRAEVFHLVNLERQKSGVAPLQEDPNLDASAQEKADDMATNHYYSHKDKNGKQGYTLVFEHTGGANSYCQYASENLADMNYQPSSENTVKAWMDSKPHREAMLDAKYTRSGVGVAFEDRLNGPSTYLVVQHFCQQK